ncbi:MAG: hypothetical protein IT423_24620 [Pirellulaceae bacterium]|nr:hypothetical protein [Pirellulaceae bacterium]
MEYIARLTRWLCLMVVACSICLAARPAGAQDEERPPEPKPTEPKPAEPKPADITTYPDVLKEGTLDLSARVYLPDGRNKPFFFPNMRVGELLDMSRAQARRAEGGDLPTYTFDELTVEAQVNGDVADIRSRVRITLNETALKVTDIPLRLQSCLLSEPVKFEGQGKSQCQVGRNEQPGYTWWLQAEPNSTHMATLVGQTVVQTEGERQSLQITLPVALATIELTLPPSSQDVSVRGQGGELLREEPAVGSRKVSIQCQGGDINVSWRTTNESKLVVGAVEATSKTRLRIDDPRDPWEADTEISLRAHGEATVDSLIIDLPEGAQWIQSATSPTEQYSISAEDPTLPAAQANASAAPAAPVPVTPTATAPVVRQKLLVRATTRVGLASLEAIPIRWRWTPSKSGTEVSTNNMSVPGINVRSVDRHEGTTTLVVPASLGIKWISGQGTDLIHQSRIGPIQEQVQYIFRFNRQPQGLTVSFRSEVNLAEVRPTYLAEIDRTQVKLTGWLQCAFDRTQQPEIGLELGDWQLDSAQVIGDLANPYAEGELLAQQFLEKNVVKLSSQLDPELSTSGRREQQLWRVVAFRSLKDLADQPLKLNVPTVVVFAPDQMPLEHASGVWLVASAGNVLVNWDAEKSQSLLTDALASQLLALQPQLPAERTQAYRFQSGARDKPVWVGRVEVLPRRIAAEQFVQVKLDTTSAFLTQRFNLQIANEPLAELQLDASGARDVSVLVDGVPWVLTAQAPTLPSPSGNNAPANVPSNTSTSSATENRLTSSDGGPLPPTVPSTTVSQVSRLTAVGGSKLFGKVVIEVRSQVPLGSVVEAALNTNVATLLEEHVEIELPLVKLDLADVVMRNPVQVTMDVDRRLSVMLGQVSSQGPVTSTDPLPADQASVSAWSPLTSAVFELPTAQNTLPLRITRLDSIDPLPVRVSGAWLQTAISGSTRVDRFCARFQTDQESITLSLPSYDLLPQVAIDGVQQDRSIDSTDGRVQISLRNVVPGDEHTIEVWTRSATSLGWLNKVEVVPVKIEGCRRFDHFYWQLVTPANQHLVLLPDTVTAEWQWHWDRMWWRRFSPKDQAYFEQWLSASPQEALAESANRYVVSSYGAVAGFQVWTASRLLLWLPIGLLSIGGALLVSFSRAFRHPAALLILVACIMSLAAVWPDLAILLGQTSLVALSIVVLYALTQAAVESRVRRRSVFTTRPTSAMLETSDQHSFARPASHASSEIVATTRTQTPIITDGGGT